VIPVTQGDTVNEASTVVIFVNYADDDVVKSQSQCHGSLCRWTCNQSFVCVCIECGARHWGVVHIFVIVGLRSRK
jgi:hypothetical protein